MPLKYAREWVFKPNCITEGIMSAADDYERLAKLDEANLWEVIGEAALAGEEASIYQMAVGLGSRQTRSERASAAASAWLARNREKLHAALCDNAELRKLFSSSPGTIVELARTIGDILTSVHLLVPVPTLAMLVARKGLEWICEE